MNSNELSSVTLRSKAIAITRNIGMLGTANHDRLAFNALSKAIEKGAVSTLIIKGVDHIMRDYHFAHNWLCNAEDKGMMIITFDNSHQPLPIDKTLLDLMNQQKKAV